MNLDEPLYRTRGTLVTHRGNCDAVDGVLIPWTFALGRSSSYIQAIAAVGTTYCSVCKPLEGRP